MSFTQQAGIVPAISKPNLVFPIWRESRDIITTRLCKHTIGSASASRNVLRRVTDHSSIRDTAMQPWALVSPASRGIGLELTRRLLQTTNVPVVATARKDVDQTRKNVLSGLQGVKEDRLHVVKLDVLGKEWNCNIESSN